MDPQVLISISKLSHTYAGTRKNPGREALKGVDLDIASGEMLALLGPNGSGKSTLLRVLTTALVPTVGAVRVGGASLQLDPAAVRRQLGVVFQKPALDGKMTVGENLWASGLLYGMGRALLCYRSRQLLQAVDLADRVDERVDSLSGGMSRRVELAKALLPEPAILMLDEPTAGLDLVARQEFWRLLETLRDGGRLTVVVSTHLLDEADRADRVAILHEGAMLVCDDPKALRRQLGREILTLSCDDAETLKGEINRAMGLEGIVVDQALRIPLEGDVSLDEVLRLFRPKIRSLTIAHPSLDDVFIRHTGERLLGGFTI